MSFDSHCIYRCESTNEINVRVIGTLDKELKPMKIFIHSDGHYPYTDKTIEITQEEWEQVERLTETQELYDTPEGEALIAIFKSRPDVGEDIPWVCVYS